VSGYIIECRHASGSSHWGREPDTELYADADAAEAVIDELEPLDDFGAPLEYRVRFEVLS